VQRAVEESVSRKCTPYERHESAIAFLQASIAQVAKLGVTVRRVLADNGSASHSRAFAIACRLLAIEHGGTHPYGSRSEPPAQPFLSGDPFGRRHVPERLVCLTPRPLWSSISTAR
jgi:hypothetical protein